MQDASQLVPNVDHHHLLASFGQSVNLGLYGLGNTRVDGATKTTVRGHTNDQVLVGILWCFDLSFFVKGWGVRSTA